MKLAAKTFVTLRDVLDQERQLSYTGSRFPSTVSRQREPILAAIAVRIER
jgi:hypothetical protein